MALQDDLTLEIHPGKAPPGWDEALLAAGGVVFHSAAWAAHKTPAGEGDPLFFVWSEGAEGEVVARGLGIRRPAKRSVAGRFAAKLVFDSTPATNSIGLDFISPLASWARRNPALLEVRLGSFDAQGSWRSSQMPHSRSRCEYLLPVGDGSEKQLWADMRQLAQRKVKRAVKCDMEAREASSPIELSEFAVVYAATEERLSQTKAYVPAVGTGSERFAESLALLTAHGRGRLFGAFSEGGLEAGVFFAVFGKRAYMIYSGSTDRGREAGAPFLAMFGALCELRAAGFEQINLGGAGGDAPDPGSIDHGLHQFKTRFGAEAEPRTSGSLIVRPFRAGAISAARRLARR